MRSIRLPRYVDYVMFIFEKGCSIPTSFIAPLNRFRHRDRSIHIDRENVWLFLLLLSLTVFKTNLFFIIALLLKFQGKWQLTYFINPCRDLFYLSQEQPDICQVGPKQHSLAMCVLRSLWVQASNKTYFLFLVILDVPLNLGPQVGSLGIFGNQVASFKIILEV